MLHSRARGREAEIAKRWTLFLEHMLTCKEMKEHKVGKYVSMVVMF